MSSLYFHGRGRACGAEFANLRGMAVVLGEHNPVPAAQADSRSSWVVIGMTEYRSTTRAWMPSRSSWSAAARQLCRVTPAPISVSRWS
jgi:hypothetical protein